MTRDEFLKLMGFGAVAAGAAICFGGCSDSTSPQNVDFTIDISQSPNDDLQTVGKYLIRNGVIVAHISQGEYCISICLHTRRNECGI